MYMRNPECGHARRQNMCSGKLLGKEYTYQVFHRCFK